MATSSASDDACQRRMSTTSSTTQSSDANSSSSVTIITTPDISFPQPRCYSPHMVMPLQMASPRSQLDNDLREVNTDVSNILDSAFGDFILWTPPTLIPEVDRRLDSLHDDLNHTINASFDETVGVTLPDFTPPLFHSLDGYQELKFEPFHSDDEAHFIRELPYRLPGLQLPELPQQWSSPLALSADIEDEQTPDSEAAAGSSPEPVDVPAEIVAPSPRPSLPPPASIPLPPSPEIAPITEVTPVLETTASLAEVEILPEETTTPHPNTAIPLSSETTPATEAALVLETIVSLVEVETQPEETPVSEPDTTIPSSPEAYLPPPDSFPLPPSPEITPITETTSILETTASPVEVEILPKETLVFDLGTTSSSPSEITPAIEASSILETTASPTEVETQPEHITGPHLDTAIHSPSETSQISPSPQTSSRPSISSTAPSETSTHPFTPATPSPAPTTSSTNASSPSTPPQFYQQQAEGYDSGDESFQGSSTSSDEQEQSSTRATSRSSSPSPSYSSYFFAVSRDKIPVTLTYNELLDKFDGMKICQGPALGPSTATAPTPQTSTQPTPSVAQTASLDTTNAINADTAQELATVQPQTAPHNDLPEVESTVDAKMELTFDETSSQASATKAQTTTEQQSVQPDQDFDIMDEDDVEMADSVDNGVGTAAAVPMDAVTQEYSEGDSNDFHMSDVNDSNLDRPVAAPAMVDTPMMLDSDVDASITHALTIPTPFPLVSSAAPQADVEMMDTTGPTDAVQPATIPATAIRGFDQTANTQPIQRSNPLNLYQSLGLSALHIADDQEARHIEWQPIATPTDVQAPAPSDEDVWAKAFSADVPPEFDSDADDDMPRQSVEEVDEKVDSFLATLDSPGQDRVRSTAFTPSPPPRQRSSRAVAPTPELPNFEDYQTKNDQVDEEIENGYEGEADDEAETEVEVGYAPEYEVEAEAEGQDQGQAAKEIEAQVQKMKEAKEARLHHQRGVLFEKGFGFFAEDDEKGVSNAMVRMLNRKPSAFFRLASSNIFMPQSSQFDVAASKKYFHVHEGIAELIDERDLSGKEELRKPLHRKRKFDEICFEDQYDNKIHNRRRTKARCMSPPPADNVAKLLEDLYIAPQPEEEL